MQAYPEEIIRGSIVTLRVDTVLIQYAVAVIAGVASAASSEKPTPEVKAYASAPKTIRQPPPSPPQKPTVLAICPKCKNRIASESKFCPQCGANLQPKKAT